MKFRSIQSQQRTSGATVFKVLGRADPVVVKDAPRIYENGSLTTMSEGSADREAIDAILDTGDSLLLQFPASHDEPDRWIEHTDHSRTRINDHSWAQERDEEIPWQRVERPSDGVGVAMPELHPALSLYPAEDLYPA